MLKILLEKLFQKVKLNQLRIAETEKYAHVTYFFNGGLEDCFDGEDRILFRLLELKHTIKNQKWRHQRLQKS